MAGDFYVTNCHVWFSVRHNQWNNLTGDKYVLPRGKVRDNWSTCRPLEINCSIMQWYIVTTVEFVVSVPIVPNLIQRRLRELREHVFPKSITKTFRIIINNSTWCHANRHSHKHFHYDFPCSRFNNSRFIRQLVPCNTRINYRLICEQLLTHCVSEEQIQRTFGRRKWSMTSSFRLVITRQVEHFSLIIIVVGPSP